MRGREKIGADNGIRTRDPQLGKLMLYQLSYVRSHVRYYSVAKHVCARTPEFLVFFHAANSASIKRRVDSDYPKTPSTSR